MGVVLGVGQSESGGGGGGGQRPLEVCDWLAAGQKNNTAATAGTKLTPFHLCYC